MTNPNAIEEQGQFENMPRLNPWQEPPAPHWYSGLGFSEDTAYLGPVYRALEGMGQGAAKGEALLSGILHAPLSPDMSEALSAGVSPEQLERPLREGRELQERGADRIEADARERVKALTPDPATTGVAAQTINGLASGGYRFATGALFGGAPAAAAFVGGSEAANRYEELREQGVDEETARRSAALSGFTSGAGAFMPGGYGSSLLTRVATGAGANVVFGTADRYLDHKILEEGGYHAMADQQKVLDAQQLFADAILGAGFGGLAHLHAGATEGEVTATSAGKPTPREVPGAEDAALTASLAGRDRGASPGVPVDPAAANAHQAALEKATSDLLRGEPVDVSGTGVDRADFAERPAPDTTAPERLLVSVLKESGILDEERNLRDLEAALEQRLSGRRPESVQTPAEPESVTSEASPEEEGYTVGEEELTDEQRQAFERLAHPQDQELQAALERGGEPGERGPQDDGGRGGLREPSGPTRVYRGGRGGALTPQHFEPETLGRATGHPSSGLGVYFTNDAADAARYGTVTEHDLTLQNPKHVPIEELPGFDTLEQATAYREQLRSEGHDGMVIDASHLGGPKHYVVFDRSGVKPVAPDSATQMLAEHPQLQIPDENGQVSDASDTLRQADAAAAQGEQEAPKATEAAINCFLRKGGA